MKNINNILKKVCIFSLVATMASCDLLDTKPYDFVAPETFYKNESDCNMALAAVYWTMAREHVYGSNYSGIFSNLDDLSYYTRKDQTSAASNLHNASNGDVYNTWEKIYSGINNANMLLDNVDKASFSDEKARMRIKGEAKFLRAYYHFILVQAWYEVPIRKETVSDITKSSLAPTPHAEALDWIIKEMEDCIDMVDDSSYDKSPSHVKKTVVEGILARVCLFRAGATGNGGKAFYEKAAKYAKAVYDSHKHSLNPNVYTLWKNVCSNQYDKEFNESMWEVEFLGTRDDGNFTEGRMGNVLGNLQENGNNDGAGYTYAFFGGSLILWDMFDAKDVRRDLSMAPYKLNNKDVQVAWTDKQLVERRCGKFRREWESSKVKNKNYTEENFCIIRYADILLMLAEAENEANQGPTALAYACLKEIRDRAGISEVKGVSYTDFQQTVRDERARELCFEGLRKYDLVRWGLYYKAVHDDLGVAVADKRWSTASMYLGAAQFVNNTKEGQHEFLPIPYKELSVNTSMVQNKYWLNK